MTNTIEAIRKEFSSELDNVSSTAQLEILKVKYLGKKGPIQDLMKNLKEVPPEKRPEFGKLINDLKVELAENLTHAENALIAKEEKHKLEQEKIDISLPGRSRFPGSKHLITQVMDDIIDIFIGMGFSVQYGPDIETDYYNFEALNFSPDHPARDMQDTFYIAPNILLRTHTTNVQSRILENNPPPLRVIAPGKVYRNETITARSHVFFHQVDGFYVERGVTFADLHATMHQFLVKFFHQEIQTRFRPSYFPFVEPGMEVDVSCLTCKGLGCNLCKHTGWLEVLGCGMIHPEVLKNADIDSEEFTGYAWGMGVERLILLKHGVKDIRLFTENDMRFLRQFPAT